VTSPSPLLRPRLLVHACCAPDALYVFGILGKDYEVTGFFSNSNIHPREEYDRRLADAREVSRRLGVSLIEDVYEPDRWLAVTRKFEDEPEKGRRCDVCYALRLERTAARAARDGFDLFTTVMSLSPWKKAPVLNRIGRQFGARWGIRFLEADFKKKDGFKRSVELSRAHDLYRQDYCGCLHSLRAAKGGDR
jgi:predicted adenine nucleotide alpha hydrolase (AANH) superfamily ATPase